MLGRPAALVTLVLLGSPAQALETPAEVLACMARNEPRTTMVQTIRLRSVDRVGSESISKARLYWRKQDGRSDLLLSFFEPEDMKGAELLIEEDASGKRSEMFLYVPALGRARRVNAQGSSGPVLGTNFSFEDLEHLYGIARYGELQAGDGQELEGRAVWVVEGHPRERPGSAYERVVLSVDSETCVPLQMEFFEAGDRLRKRLRIDPAAVRSSGTTRLPGAVRMSDLRAETSSELIVETFEVDAEIPDGTFTPAWRSSGP